MRGNKDYVLLILIFFEGSEEMTFRCFIQDLANVSYAISQRENSLTSKLVKVSEFNNAQGESDFIRVYRFLGYER